MADWKAKQPQNETDEHGDIPPVNIPLIQSKTVAVSCPFYLTILIQGRSEDPHLNSSVLQ